MHVLGLLPRCHVPNHRDLNRNKSQNNRTRRGTRTPVRRLEPKKNQNSVSTGAETPTSWKITNELVWSQPYDVSAAIGPQNPMPARPFGKNRTKGPFKNKFRFCWRLFGLLARRERRAYPQRSVRIEQRSQQAKEPQPGGAGRRRAICFLARRSQPHGGGCSLLAPRIWPDGAPARIGSYF